MHRFILFDYFGVPYRMDTQTGETWGFVQGSWLRVPEGK